MHKTLFILLFLFGLLQAAFAQPGSNTVLQQKPDSAAMPGIRNDSISVGIGVSKTMADIINDNRFLNTKAKAISFYMMPHKQSSNGILFLALVLISFFFAIIKTAYPKYFTNLLRVFFNTSLRQSQLTDQLLSAPQPSIMYNILFVLVSGTYIFLLLKWYHAIDAQSSYRYLLLSIISICIVYVVKYLSLIFFGWLTNLKRDAGIYSFNIFLVNKVMGISLLPLLFIVAFAKPQIAKIGVVLSMALIIILLLLRFYKSFGMLQGKISLSKWHFMLYVICVEILPILLIIKFAIVFFK